MRKLNEHEEICNGCGKVLDYRNLGGVLSHGWIEDGEIVCYDDDIDVDYSGAQKIGSSEFYPKDKNEPINLN